jgi:hypothetical protein
MDFQGKDPVIPRQAYTPGKDIVGAPGPGFKGTLGVHGVYYLPEIGKVGPEQGFDKTGFFHAYPLGTQGGEPDERFLFLGGKGGEKEGRE